MAMVVKVKVRPHVIHEFFCAPMVPVCIVCAACSPSVSECALAAAIASDSWWLLSHLMPVVSNALVIVEHVISFHYNLLASLYLLHTDPLALCPSRLALC
jgi:hypothetical protein